MKWVSLQPYERESSSLHIIASELQKEALKGERIRLSRDIKLEINLDDLWLF